MWIRHTLATRAKLTTDGVSVDPCLTLDASCASLHPPGVQAGLPRATWLTFLCSAKSSSVARPPTRTATDCTRYHRRTCSERRLPSSLTCCACCGWCSGPERHSLPRTCCSERSLPVTLNARSGRAARTTPREIALALLSQFVEWRELLMIVRPETLVRWHRDLFRLFWRLKSRCAGQE